MEQDVMLKCMVIEIEDLTAVSFSKHSTEIIFSRGRRCSLLQIAQWNWMEVIPLTILDIWQCFWESAQVGKESLTQCRRPLFDS